MISWYKFMFLNASNTNMEFMIMLNDFIMMFLSSIILIVLINLIFLLYFKLFYTYFYESDSLEIIWTLIPFFILLFILIPSLKFLYILDSIFIPMMSIFVLGHQWYWSYFFSNFKKFFLDCYMMKSKFNIRLIETDNKMILSSMINYRILGTSMDVIHSWTIPSLGLKMDVIPGRISQMSLCFNREGIFYGQCSEICGINHSFMPIFIEVLNIFDYFNIFLI